MYIITTITPDYTVPQGKNCVRIVEKNVWFCLPREKPTENSWNKYSC